MSMNKIEFLKGERMVDHFNDYVWDEWFNLRCKKNGINYHEDKDAWDIALSAMPRVFGWYVDNQTDEMVFDWDGGEERFPLSTFIDDEDEQPDLEMVWHENYYDGPLSGVARYNGQYVWFELVEEDDYGNREMGIYSMTPENKAEVFRRHNMFQENVGYHCDHNPGVHKPFVCKDKKKFDSFYNTKQKKMSLNNSDNLLLLAQWFQFKNWARPR